MALAILDGTQTATTLSTILSSGQHITAHTVVSLGSQAITDIVNATSAGLTDTQLRASAITVGGTITIGNSLTIGGGTVTIGAGTAQIGSVTASISGTVTAMAGTNFAEEIMTGILEYTGNYEFFPILGTVTIGSALPNGTNRIGVVTIGAGTVTIGAGTAQIGSVTASISGTVPVSGTFFQATQPVSLASLPSLVAGTSQIGSVTASISGTIPISIASVTIGNSITISSLPALVAGTAQIGSVTVGNSITIGSIVTHGVTIANTSVTVNGTFFQATQPVSLITLPSLVSGTAQIGSVTASISGTIPISISSVTIGNSITISNFPATQPISISSVTIGNSLTIGSIVTHGVTIANTSVTVNGTFFQATQPISISSITIGNSVTISSLPAITGTVTANVTTLAFTTQGGIASSNGGSIPTYGIQLGYNNSDGEFALVDFTNGYPITGSVAVKGLDTNEDQTQIAVTTSGSVLASLSSALPAGTNQIGSVTASISGTVPISISSVTVGNSVTIGSLPAISGTVTANIGYSGGIATEVENGIFNYIDNNAYLPIYGTVVLGAALPAGTNSIGVVTIGAGTVTIGAGTQQIGSVTASISGTVPISISSVTIGNFPATQPISISSVTIGNSVTIASLPLISGTVTAMAGGDFGASIENVGDVGNVTKKIAVQLYDESGSAVGISINPLPISGTVTANTFAVQGTAVTTSNFTSTTASTVLANYNATRQVLTIFNEGAGNLHICGGATCTTIAYQVRLSAGDYYEVPNHQTTITHSAVFATAGTARVTQVS